MNKDSLLPLLVLALGLTLTLPASATLIGRDLDISIAGFEAYYDDVLDITWQANANLLASNSFGLAYDTQLGDHPSTIFVETDNQLFIKIVGDGTTRGLATWGGALHWIDAMNAANYLGFSDWRLPTLTPVGGGTTFNTTTSNNGSTDVGWGFTGTESELAHLWYSTLENLGLCEPNGGGSTTSCIPQAGSGLMNTGPFQDLSFSFFGRTYWTGEEFAPSPSAAWTFGTRHGTQTIFNKNADFLVWAVHSGDVAALPEPGSIALFGLGLLGLIVAQRRHRVGA